MIFVFAFCICFVGSERKEGMDGLWVSVFSRGDKSSSGGGKACRHICLCTCIHSKCSEASAGVGGSIN